jgi:hypothetical protein
MGASRETNAFASEVRWWTSGVSEVRRAESAPVLISRAAADWIVHWSKTASVTPASKHNPGLFGLFPKFRPSTVEDKGQISETSLNTAPRRVPCQPGSYRSVPCRLGSCLSASCPLEPVDRRAAGAEGRRRQRQSAWQVLHPLQSQFSTRDFSLRLAESVTC